MGYDFKMQDDAQKQYRHQLEASEEDMKGLLERWQQFGDESARNQLFELIQEWMYQISSGTLTKMMSQERVHFDTTELGQTLSEKLLDRLAVEHEQPFRWKSKSEFCKFVVNTARNTVLDRLKSYAVRMREHPAQEELGESRPLPSTQIQRDGADLFIRASSVERVEIIIEAIAKFAEQHPEDGLILQMNQICGCSPARIVRLIDRESGEPLTEDSVRLVIKEAIVWIRDNLSRSAAGSQS